MKRRSILTVALVASALALAAYPGKQADAAEITMYAWDAIWTDTAIKDLSGRVSAEIPAITGVKLAKVPYPDFISGLNVKLLGRKAPEVVTMHPSFKNDYIDTERLVDLKPIIDRDFPGYDLADFDDQILSGWSRPVGCSWQKGAKVPCEHLYGAPYHQFEAFILFNKTAYAKAGLETPDVAFAKGQWTWERARKDAKALVDSGAVKYGFAPSDFGVFTANGWLTLPTLYYAYGAEPFAADGKTCSFNSENMIKATQLYWDMTFTDKSIPAPGSTASPTSFANGEVGIQQSGYQLPTTLAAKPADIKFEYGIAPPLGGPAGYRPFVQDKALVVMKDSVNPELGAKFALWYTSKKSSIANLAFSQPPRKSVWESPEFTSTKMASGLVTPEMWTKTVLPLYAPGATWPLQYTAPGLGSIHTNTLPIFQQLWKPDARNDIPRILADTCAAMDRLLKN